MAAICTVLFAVVSKRLPSSVMWVWHGIDAARRAGGAFGGQRSSNSGFGATGGAAPVRGAFYGQRTGGGRAAGEAAPATRAALPGALPAKERDMRKSVEAGSHD